MIFVAVLATFWTKRDDGFELVTLSIIISETVSKQQKQLLQLRITMNLKHTVYIVHFKTNTPLERLQSYFKKFHVSYSRMQSNKRSLNLTPCFSIIYQHTFLRRRRRDV